MIAGIMARDCHEPSIRAGDAPVIGIRISTSTICPRPHAGQSFSDFPVSSWYGGDIRVRDWIGWDDRRNAQQFTASRDFYPAVTAAAAILRA